jgi:hypothetical protein
LKLFPAEEPPLHHLLFRLRRYRLKEQYLRTINDEPPLAVGRYKYLPPLQETVVLFETMSLHQVMLLAASPGGGYDILGHYCFFLNKRHHTP